MERARQDFEQGQYGQAVEAWRGLAEQGSPEAAFRLAACYVEGQGVPASEAEGLRWFLEAAERGNPVAQFNMAVAASQGSLGAPKDEQHAVAWYERAAAQGHTASQYNLAVRRFEGRGAPKDLGQAWRWFQVVAVSAKDPVLQASAAFWRDRAAGGLSQPVLEEAREQAALFKPVAEEGRTPLSRVVVARAGGELPARASSEPRAEE